MPEKIDFGVGHSMPVHPDQMKRAEDFLEKVLACELLHRGEFYTTFRFPNGGIIGLTPSEKALSESQYEHSTWLEIVSSDYKVTKQRIKEFGVTEVPSSDSDIYVFHIPGGAVLRLISEEMARELSGS